MKIKESRIRQIIREEAKKALQEMPYAGSLGIRKGTDDFRRNAQGKLIVTATN